MFNRLFIIACSLFISLSSAAQDYEVLKKGSDLLLKEPLRMVFVGTDVLAPIPLPYKDTFLLLTANSNGYATTVVSSDYDLTNWIKTNALVFEGDFLDAYSGNEIFIQGKGISFSGGAKNGYITRSNAYISIKNDLYGARLASASISELSMLIKDEKAYLQLNQANGATVNIRDGLYDYSGGLKIGSVHSVKDNSVIISPTSNVAANGSFSTSYPITFPHAEGGLAPNIAISYVGGGVKNSALGFAFSILGIETINICPFNSDSDISLNRRTNLVTSIKLRNLCYGGRSLIPSNNLNQSSNGASNEWFELDGDPLSRFQIKGEGIILHQADGSEKYFKKVNDLVYSIVESKNIYENKITYTYHETGTKVSEPQLDTIVWGDYSAKFEYSHKRTDFNLQLSTDEAQFYSEVDLLTDIYIKKDSAIIHSNHISYQQLATNNRYVVESIQSCGHIPSKSCSEPIYYEWESNANLASIQTQVSLPDLSAEKIITAKLKGGIEESFYIDEDRILYLDGKELASLPSHTRSVIPIEINGKSEFFVLVDERGDTKRTWDLIDSTVKRQSGYCDPKSEGVLQAGSLNAAYFGSGISTNGSSCIAKKGPGNYCRSNNDSRPALPASHNGLFPASPARPATNSCYGPTYNLLAYHSSKYSWYKLTVSDDGKGLSQPVKVTDAGCTTGRVADEKYSQSTPFISYDDDFDGIKEIYLRTITQNGTISSTCMTPDNQTQFDMSYVKYAGGDTSKAGVISVHAGSTDTGVAGLAPKLDAALPEAQVIYQKADVAHSTSYDDLDGNGTLDKVEYEKYHLKVTFNGFYTGDQLIGGSDLRKLSKKEVTFTFRTSDSRSSTHRANSFVLYDLDHDGIKEIIYTAGYDVNYLKYFYDPLVGQVIVNTHTLLKNVGSGSSGHLRKLSLADFNGDGKVELAILKGKNTLSSKVKALVVVDLNTEFRLSKIQYGKYVEEIGYDDLRETIEFNDQYIDANGIVQIMPNNPPVKSLIKTHGNTVLANFEYRYTQPLVHKQHRYNLGFESVTITDNLKLHKTENHYYQELLKKGLMKSSASSLSIAGAYKPLSETNVFYNIKDDKRVEIDYSVDKTYVRGIEAGLVNTSYVYDNYGRINNVTTKQFDTAGVELKNQVVDNTYKNTSFVFTEAYDNLLTQQDTTITIPAGSSLVTTGYQAGTNTSRTKYIESTSIPGTIAETQSGYVKNSTFTQLSSAKVALDLSDNGNPSQVIKTGFAASTAAANDTLVFTSYDGANPTGITHKFGGNEFGTSSYSYDALGRLLSETTIEGNTTSYTYDAFGRVKTLMTTRDSATYEYLSCADGNACSGLTPSTVSDNIVWMNSVTWTSGKIERSFVDAHGRNVASSWNNELDQTLFTWSEFDAKGRLSKEYLPCKLGTCSDSSPHTLYEYEANGNDIWQTKKTLADGTVVKNTIKIGSCFDAFNSLEICKNSADETVSPLYISETLIDGNQPALAGHSSITDTAQAATTHKTYQVVDQAGQLFASVEGSDDASRGVVFSKNILGDITQVHHRDGDGTNTQLVRSYEYFESGLLKTDTNAVGVKEVYAYNSAGIIDNTYSFGADAKLYGTNSYDFDTYGRLKASYENHSDEGAAIETSPEDGSYTYPSATFNKPRSQIYSYDSASITEGRPAGYVCNKYYPCAEKSSSNGIDSIKHFNFTADGLLDKKIEIIKGDGETRNASFAYGYSTYGDLQTETLSGTGLTSYGLTYTNHNRGTTTITDSSDLILWQLTATDNKGAPSSISILGGSETLFDTDSLGREVTRSTLDGASNTISNWNQNYNHLGTNAYRQSAMGTPQAENFQYDAFGQIDNTEIDSTQPYDFNIDSLANLTALRGANITRSTLDTGCATNANIAGANLRTGSSPWIVSGNDQVAGSYCYDQMGRQLINGENTIEYFANGQAAKIKNSTAEINLAYDASGTPIHEKQTSSIASKNYSAWLFDGARVEQRNDNGVLSTRFYPINNLRISFASNSSTPIYDFVMTDTMGSTTGLARKSGDQLIVDPAKTRGYTPYGSQRNPDDWDVIQDIDIGDAYGFTGQRYLAEFGLYQYVGRIYDPKLGSFTGPDPIVAGEGNWKAYNPYTYVFNDPLGLVDPSGYGPQAYGGTFTVVDNPNYADIRAQVDRDIAAYNYLSTLSTNFQTGQNNLLISSVNNTQFHFNQNLVLDTGFNNASLACNCTPIPGTYEDLGTISATNGSVLRGAGYVAANVISGGLAFGDMYSESSLNNSSQTNADIGAFNGAYPYTSAMAAAVGVARGRVRGIDDVLTGLSKSGAVIASNITRKGVAKKEILFANRSDAMNWAKQQLGHSAKRSYNAKGQWNGWVNNSGGEVYWNHGDWGKGVGKSTFPHLNYKLDGQKGHLFLGDKIKNKGMWNDFVKEFSL